MNKENYYQPTLSDPEGKPAKEFTQRDPLEFYGLARNNELDPKKIFPLLYIDPHPGFEKPIGESFPEKPVDVIDKALVKYRRTGECQVVFITGKLGVGKTALAEQLMAYTIYRLGDSTNVSLMDAGPSGYGVARTQGKIDRSIPPEKYGLDQSSAASERLTGNIHEHILTKGGILFVTGNAVFGEILRTPRQKHRRTIRKMDDIISTLITVFKRLGTFRQLEYDRYGIFMEGTQELLTNSLMERTGEEYQADTSRGGRFTLAQKFQNETVKKEHGWRKKGIRKNTPETLEGMLEENEASRITKLRDRIARMGVGRYDYCVSLNKEKPELRKNKTSERNKTTTKYMVEVEGERVPLTKEQIRTRGIKVGGESILYHISEPTN